MNFLVNFWKILPSVDVVEIAVVDVIVVVVVVVVVVVIVLVVVEAVDGGGSVDSIGSNVFIGIENKHKK